MESWCEVEPLSDALSSLAKCRRELEEFRSDPIAIKWVLISLHSSVQGFIALVLNQGNGLLVMSADDAKEWLKAHDNHGTYPDSRMDFFMNLYKKTKKPNSYRGYSGATPFASEGHDMQMRWLNEQRNQFIHFNVSRYYIDVSGVHTLVQKAMDVIEYCCSSPAFPWHRYDDADSHRATIEQLVSDIRKGCEEPFIHIAPWNK